VPARQAIHSDTRREVQEDFNVYYFTCRALRWL
jgi:hypothetical protein